MTLISVTKLYRYKFYTDDNSVYKERCKKPRLYMESIALRQNFATPLDMPLHRDKRSRQNISSKQYMQVNVIQNI